MHILTDLQFYFPGESELFTCSENFVWTRTSYNITFRTDVKFTPVFADKLFPCSKGLLN